jgi:hypothetical protein
LTQKFCPKKNHKIYFVTERKTAIFAARFKKLFLTRVRTRNVLDKLGLFLQTVTIRLRLGASADEIAAFAWGLRRMKLPPSPKGYGG